jgi:hypothetical protein
MRYKLSRRAKHVALSAALLGGAGSASTIAAGTAHAATTRHHR